jgi:PAS domain S-box-containing protein
MDKGGNSYYTPRSELVFRYAGIIVPVILILYGLLAKPDINLIAHPIDSVGLYLLSFWWLCVSALQYWLPSKTRFDTAMRLVAYHLLAGSYLIFISGVFSPFTICWLLLVLASYIYFSRLGFMLSIAAFTIVIFVDILSRSQTSTSIVVNDLAILTTVLITSIGILYVSKSQEVDRIELDRAKAQELLQRDRILTIVNNLGDAVLSTDVNGIIRVYNAASLNLLDTNDSLNGQHIDEVLPLVDQENNAVSLFKEFQNAKTVIKRDDLNYNFEDGESIRLEITFSTIRSSYNSSRKSETRDGYVVIMRDITKAKSLEEERDEFISVTSHELRTPIAIAEGTISNIQAMLGHPDVTDDMIKDSIKMAHDQVIFLASMVNDLSTLSRAERGVSDETEDIDVRELAHKLYDKYVGDAKERKLHLNLDLSPKLGKVKASRLYLEELLQNFITNSLKYTKKGSVTIIMEQKAGSINFAVKDTGIGISKSDREKVFNKFYRSEDYRTRETGGTGLGLYIAAKLARKIGAKIQLTSRLNFGSTFSFTLPISDEQTKS